MKKNSPLMIIFISSLLVGCNNFLENSSNDDLNLSSSEVNSIEDTDNQYIIDDIKIFYDHKNVPSCFSKNTYINFNLLIKFNKDSKNKVINNELVDLIYNEDMIEVNLIGKEISNEFAYSMKIKQEGNVKFIAKIDEYSKEFNFDFSNSVIETPIIFTKNKMNTNIYNITPVYSLEEYDSFIKDNKIESYSAINNDFFDEYFIVIVPIGISSSTVSNEYVSSFISNNKIWFNYILEEENNLLYDYFENLYFIKVSNQYIEYGLEKLVSKV